MHSRVPVLFSWFLEGNLSTSHFFIGSGYDATLAAEVRLLVPGNQLGSVHPISAHSIEHIHRGAIQVDQNIAGVLVPAIGVNVEVVSLPIVGAEKRDGGRTEQLRCAPQTLPRQWLPGLIVNQTNQLQVIRHRGKLPANGLGGQVCNSACVSNSGSVQRRRSTIPAQLCTSN